MKIQYKKTDVAREQVQRIDDGGNSFEIENVVEEALETNVITVNAIMFRRALKQ